MSKLPVFDKKDHPRGGRTCLDEVLPLVVTTLSRQLVPDDGWKRWAAVIKDYEGDHKYRMAEVRMLERERNPIECIWSGLTMDARDLNYVKESLTEAALYYSADFISDNVLKSGRVPRPVAPEAGPPAMLQVHPTGPPIAPPTTLLQAPAANFHPPSSGSVSSGPGDFHDGTSVEYNGEMSDRERNIETSGEFENENQGAVKTYRLDVRQENSYAQKPVHEGNLREVGPSKEERQKHLVRQIQELVNLSAVQLEPGKPHEFQYNELDCVTQNFDHRQLSENGRLIGTGGFGEVFLGIMHGTKIAVKRMTNKTDQIASSQFKAEVDAMSWLVHDNLLPLLGYSVDGKHMCIVYEYMSKGSLEDALVCKNNATPLTVKQRLEIACGTTKGIVHLHSRDPALVHRDIKSANILLSDDLTPKIGDFGLARLGPQPTSDCIPTPETQKTHQQTKTIIGTTAYMPPEAYSGEIAPRWDCYSLGVLIQELVTGLPAYDPTRTEKLLPYHILENCDDEEEFMSLADSKAEPWNEEVISKLYKVTKNCLEHKKSKRWNATQIQDELTSLVL